MRTTWDGRDIVNRLERGEQFRRNVTRAFARLSIARRAGVAPGTLERIACGRVKDLKSSVRDRLVALLIRELEAEIKANEHDLAVLLRSGARPDKAEIREIETHLALARGILSRAVIAPINPVSRDVAPSAPLSSS